MRQDKNEKPLEKYTWKQNVNALVYSSWIGLGLDVITTHLNVKPGLEDRIILPLFAAGITAIVGLKDESRPKKQVITKSAMLYAGLLAGQGIYELYKML